LGSNENSREGDAKKKRDTQICLLLSATLTIYMAEIIVMSALNPPEPQTMFTLGNGDIFVGCPLRGSRANGDLVEIRTRIGSARIDAKKIVKREIVDIGQRLCLGFSQISEVGDFRI
jgi:hypothetical protein